VKRLKLFLTDELSAEWEKLDESTKAKVAVAVVGAVARAFARFAVEEATNDAREQAELEARIRKAEAGDAEANSR